MNKQLILKKRPLGMPEADTWELIESPIPEPSDGEIVIKNHYISLDSIIEVVFVLVVVWLKRQRLCRCSASHSLEMTEKRKNHVNSRPNTYEVYEVILCTQTFLGLRFSSFICTTSKYRSTTTVLRSTISRSS